MWLLPCKERKVIYGFLIYKNPKLFGPFKPFESVSEKIICTSGNSIELFAISVSDFAASMQCSQPASKKHNIFFPSLILKSSFTYVEYEETCLLLEFVAIGNNENIRTEIIK